MNRFLQDIANIRQLRGISYQVLARAPDNIPSESGIYIWRYWPTIKSYEYDELVDILKRIQETYPILEDSANNSKAKLIYQRNLFGQQHPDGILGVLGEGKQEKLKVVLSKSEAARKEFLDALELIFLSAPPLYVGKAFNFKDRLKQHFERRSSVLSTLESAGIDMKDVYISFIKDEISSDLESVTESIEHILQCLVNPSFTKRYG